MRIEAEDGSLTKSATGGSCTVEIAVRFTLNQRRIRQRSFVSRCKRMQRGENAARSDLKDRAASTSASKGCGSIEVPPGSIDLSLNQRRTGIRSIGIGGAETIESGERRGNVTQRDLEYRADAVHAASLRCAVEVAVAAED